MLATSALLPIAGRAASTIRFPGWKPPVMSSRSRKPGGRPGHLGVAAGELLEPVELVVEDLADAAEVARLLLVGDLEQELLGALGQAWRGSPSRSWTQSWICWPAPSRRRSSAFCWTISA